MKNQKGITLIALVITIIVLLILAGVAIAMLSGNNGILTKASSSAKETAVSSAKEQIGVVINGAITEYYDDVYVTGTKATKELGVGAAVVNAVAGIDADAYDDITLTPPTAVSAAVTGDTTFTMTYKGDGTVYTGTIGTDGKLSWDK